MVTNTYNGPTATFGPLKWSVNIVDAPDTKTRFSPAFLTSSSAIAE